MTLIRRETQEEESGRYAPRKRSGEGRAGWWMWEDVAVVDVFQVVEGT